MKKGFTLTEVLAVITVLGVLSLIAIITIDSSLKDSKEEAYNTQVQYILDSARMWAGKHVFELPENEEEYIIITIAQLKQTGDINKEVINPKTDEPFDDNTEIKISKKNNDYAFEIIE